MVQELCASVVLIDPAKLPSREIASTVKQGVSYHLTNRRTLCLDCHLQIASNYLQTVVFHITRDISISQNYEVALLTSHWPWERNLHVDRAVEELIFCICLSFFSTFKIFQIV